MNKFIEFNQIGCIPIKKNRFNYYSQWKKYFIL